MRSSTNFAATAVVAAALLGIATVPAQDRAQVDPDMRVLIDNACVRVQYHDVGVGQTVPMHSHPQYVVYPLEDYKVKVKRPDGSEAVSEHRAGDVHWNKATTHSIENIGTSEVHNLIVEVRSGTACEASGSAAAPTSEQALIKIQNDWAKARIEGDVPFLENLYAKEFRVQNMGGTVNSRAQDIAMFAVRPRLLKPAYIVDEDMQVSDYGNAAVVTGIENLKGTYRDQYAEMALRFTNVFVRRDGRWQMVIHQSTPMRSSAGGPSSGPPSAQSQSDSGANEPATKDKPASEPASATEQAGAEDEIRKLLLAAIERFNRQEVQPPGVAAFAPDADFVNVEGMWMKGAQEIYRGHKQASSSKLKGAKITLLDLTVRFARPDVAIVHQLHEMSGSLDPDGKKLPPHRQLSTRVLVKERGRWLTSAFQNTRVHPTVVAAAGK